LNKTLKNQIMKKLLLSFTLVAFSSIGYAQWTSQGTGFSAVRGLSEVRAIDANTVWGLAYDGAAPTNNIQEFTRTTTGGSSWTAGTVNIGNPLLEINNLCPADGTTAWVSALIPADGNGVIYKTNDGGVNWVQQLDTAFITSGESFLNSVYFFNPNDGVAYGDPVGGEYEIYTTSDGGDNWTAVPAASKPNPLPSEYGYNSAPTAVGNKIWFTTNKGRLYISSDKGLTWAVAQAPLTDFGAAAQSGTVEFSDTANGCLIKTIRTGTAPNYVFTRTLYTTSDGGITWSTGTPFTGTRFILTYIPGTTTIVATSQAAPVGTSISTNNGATWTDVESGAQRGAAAFINATTGWCAGFSTADPFAVEGIFKLTGPLANDSFSATDSIKVFPNPATNLVTISSEQLDSYTLSVTDLTGKVVIEKSMSGMENSVDVSNLSSGAYFFTIASDSKKETIKIIKN
jgi:photosystem II stability/assembly factor-like uncharacterized protein